MIRRLFPWRREPKEPLTSGRHRYTYGHGAEDALCECQPDYRCEHNGPVPLPAVSHVDTARPAPHLSATPDRQPTGDLCPQQTQRVDAEHVGATEEFGDLLHAMREDLAHGDASLDPDDIAWREAFQAVELVIEFEAAQSRARLHKQLDRFAPGWRNAICGERHCPRCATSFDEVMEQAGVIALPAEPVDYSTAEYAVIA